MHPLNGRFVAKLSHQIHRKLGNRSKGTVVDFRTFYNRHIFIEQIHHTSGDSRFCLTAQTQQIDVVTGQNRFFELRHNGIFITHESFKNRLFRFDASNQIRLDLLIYGFVGIARCFQCFECGFLFHL